MTQQMFPGLDLCCRGTDPAHLITVDTGYSVGDLYDLYDLYHPYDLYDLDHDLSEVRNVS